MSNIGKINISCPEWVKCEIHEYNTYSSLWISGESFTWKHKLKSPFLALFTKDALQIYLPKFYNKLVKLDKKNVKPLNNEWSHHTVTLQKMVKSAFVGFRKYLRIIGVGYNFSVDEIQGSNLLIAHAGLTHLLRQELHPSISVEFSRKKRLVRAKSACLSILTNTLASVRNTRKPNVFTGKGIRFRKQKVNLKVGKKKKA